MQQKSRAELFKKAGIVLDDSPTKNVEPTKFKMHIVTSCHDCYFSDGDFCTRLFDIKKPHLNKAKIKPDGKILSSCPLPNYNPKRKK